MLPAKRELAGKARAAVGRRSAIMASFLVGALCFPVGASRAQTEGETESLRGLREVHLTLRAVGGAGEERPVAVESFRPAVEKLLAQSDIGLVQTEDLPEKPDVAYLAITVRSEQAGPNRVYAIELRVKDRATLVRDPSKVRSLTSWSAGDVGLTPMTDDVEIGSSIEALLAKFLAAHHQSNPD
jgi:hypothetical protein